MDYKIGKVIELIIKALPYSDQMNDIEIGKDNVRFDWRGTRYCVNTNLGVDEVGDGVLIGTDKSMLIRTCLQLVAGRTAS